MKMTSSYRRRGLAAGVAILLGLGTTACGNAAMLGDDNPAEAKECAPYQKYQGHKGTKVRMTGSSRDLEANLLQQALRRFGDCTGIEFQYEGDAAFENTIRKNVADGETPDLAIFAQPGLLKDLIAQGAVKPASAEVEANGKKGWNQDWLDYGSVDGTFYAAPMSASVKSLVWYSPKTFAKKGYQVPQNWDELIALSDRIAADGEKPWCAGIESGDATGWPATDWMEDVALRVAGPEAYDSWVSHEIPFNDPQIAAVTDKVGSILKNPRYVNAGIGGVKSIATTSFQAAGLPVLSGKCTMHRQASFYAGQWPRGTQVAEDGDVYAFYFPAIDPAKGKPTLVAGEFLAAFTDRPEVQAVQAYMSSGEFATSRASMGGWVSANKNVDMKVYSNPVDHLSAEILQDEKTVARFDGSDMMPGSVGAGTFWVGMTNWIKGASTKATLNAIEASWP
ncbi:ABC transporter substrate-binding protein [Actinoplanes hulinensis]|uniref:ABC transporter substrate-binding protein n=2 Tax=Actinoplanes hulinensis TaxID=1144547 RepID=A0ABS7BF38_9ACTN|nr:ABC transporter substrate-binding protein [Actinoplanes hulinensis]MBW6439497.1 ABC transporter substrate-binding protein [Actinoplanes hulinensis]